ncbi:PAS domain S-box protein [Methanolobus psychrotolerans]|uniref:PAS domain S-box protein n=1 Tax=Methanolobus psychrotolerans TaxID=1874706 RepID=UPI000B91631B|nr:PAS domain S-box protein [Methanolobus psychrotolerans]
MTKIAPSEEYGKNRQSISHGNDGRTEHVCKNGENNNNPVFVEALLETIPEPVFYKDISGKYIGCNRAFEEFTGKPKEEIIGRTVYDMGPRELAEKYENMDRKLFEQQGKQIYQWKVMSPDGLEKDVVFHKIAFTDHSGKVAGLIGLIVDITEMNRSLMDLGDSEKDIHALLNASTESVLLIDITGKVLASNETVAQRMGTSVGMLRGKNIYDFVSEDVAKRRRQKADEVVAKGKPVHFEDERNGHIIHNSIYPVFDHEGKTEKLAIFGVDITAFKEAEYTIIAREELYRTTIETSIDGYWHLDMEGRICEVNDAYCRLTGYTREELLGMSISDLDVNEDPEQAAAHICKVKERGIDRFETKHQTKDGRILTIEVSTAYSEKAGQGLFCFLRDITERKQAEEREQHLKQVLLAVRNVNQLLVRENDPDRLIEQACSNLTGTLGYYNAWMVLLDTNGSVTATAVSGVEIGCAAIKKQLESGNLPFCMTLALEHNDIVIVDHPDANCADCSLSCEHTGMSGMANRLQFGDRVYGLLAVMIPSEFAHDKEEQDLFVEIADDLSFALHKIAAEKAFRESEQNYRTLANTGQALIWTSGKDGLCNYFNLPWMQFTGRTLEQDLGEGWLDNVHPDDMENCLKTYSDAFDRREKFSMEYRLRRHDGEYRWVIDDGSPRYDSTGQFIGYIGHCLDITERKVMEDALRKSEAHVKRKLSAIVEPEGDIGTLELADIIDHEALQSLMDDFFQLTQIGGGAIVDLHGKVLVATSWQDICTKFHRVNPKTCANCIESDTQLSKGVSPDTFKLYRCKNNMWDISTPIMVGDSHMGNLFFGQFFFDDEELPYETFRLQANKYGFDENEYLEALERVPRLDRTKVETVMAFYTKLTDMISTLSYSNIKLARTLNELGHSHELMHYIIGHTQSAVAVHDRDLKYIYVSQRYLDEYKVKEEDVIGKHHYDVFPDLPQKWRDVHQKALQGIVSSSEEDPYEREDGSVDWTRWECRPWYEADGSIGGIVVYTEIITERKKAEEALENEVIRRRILIDQSGDGIVVLDENGKVYEANQQFADMLGYSPEEVSQLYLWGWDTEFTREQLLEMVRDVNETGDRFETRHRRKDGSFLDVEISTNGAICNGEKLVFCVCRDISERKQAEKALRQSEERFAQLFEQAPLGYQSLDDEGRFLMVNEAWLETLGYKREEVIGKWFGDFLAPEFVEVYCERFPVFKAKGIIQSEFEMLHKTGERRLISFEGRIGHKIDGSFEQTHCILLDITERKRAEEALRESESFLSDAQSIANISSFVCDLENGSLEYSSNLLKLAGLSDETFSGNIDSLMSDLVHPDDRSFVEEEKKKMFELRRAWPIEFRVVLPDGKERIWQSRSRFMLDRNGIPIKCIGTHQDITEKRESDEKMQVLASLMTTSPASITVHDFEGNILYSNPNTYKLHGYSQDEAAQLNLQQLDDPQTAQKISERMQEIMDKGSASFEAWHIKKDGTKFPLQVSTKRVHWQGKDAVLSVALDITDQKRAEAKLEEEAIRRRILIEQSPDGIVVLDEHGKVFETNQKFAEMLGYSPAETLELHVWDWDQQWTQEELLEMIRGIDADGLQFETVHRHKNGSEIYMEISANGAVCSGQKLVFCVCRDISERKQFEEQMKIYEQIVSSTQDGISLVDKNYRYVTVNNAYEMFSGRGREELVGLTVAEYLGKEVFENEVLEYFDRCLKGKIVSYQAWIHYPILGKRFVDITYSPYIDNDGEIAGVVSNTRDITDTKKAEEALKETSDRLILATRAGGVGIWDYDIENNTLLWDEQMFRLYGITPDQFDGAYEAWKTGLHPDDVERCDSETQMALRGEKEFDTEFRVVWNNGTVRNIRALAIVQRDGSGQPLHMIGTNWDVTDQKLAEEELKKREKLLSKIFEILPIGLWFVDSDGKLQSGNPEGVRIWGAEPHVGIGEYRVFKARRLPSGEELAPDEWALARTIREGITVEQEMLEIDAFDGEKRIILNYSAPVLDDDGDLMGVIVVNEDITSLKDTEKALHASEQLFKTVFEQASVGVAQATPDGRLLKMNSRFCEIVGYSSDELISMNFRDITHPDDLHLEEKYIMQVSAGEIDSAEFEKCYIHKNGHNVWVKVYSKVIRDEYGSILYAIAVVIDISEQKSAEKALKESEERLSLAMEASSTGFWDLDLDTYETYMSSEIYTMSGYGPDELAKDLYTFLSLIHPDDVETITNTMNTAINLLEPLHVDLRIKHRSGEWIWVSMKGRATEIDEKGRSHRLIGTQVDITPRIKAEEALLYARAAADESNRMKSELLKNVTHELRTPLTAVIGFSDLLLSGNIENNESKHKEYARYIHQSGQDLLTIVNRILDYTNAEYGLLEPLQLQRVNIDDLLSQTRGLLLTKALKKDIKIITKTDNDLTDIIADENKFKDILYNLVDNAIKFTHNEGSITIEAKSSNGTVQFSVHDTGIGIEHEKIDKIFEPFVQIDGSISRKYGGTGLGLALVKKLVEMHGGNIWVESEVGNGSNFIFNIPLNTLE